MEAILSIGQIVIVFSHRFSFPFSVSPVLPVMREGVEMAAGGRLFLWQAIDPLACSGTEKWQE